MLQGALGEDWQSRKNFTQTEAASALRYLLTLVKHEPASVLPETWEALKDLASALPGVQGPVEGVATSGVMRESRPQRAAKQDGSELRRSDDKALLKRRQTEMDRPLAPQRLVADIIRPCKITGKTPLARETGRGDGKPDFPIGAIIVTRKNEDGETVEFGKPKMVGLDLMCDQVRRGTATIVCHSARPCFMRAAHTAYCWALLVERKVKAAIMKAGHMPPEGSQRVKLLDGTSLRSRDHDIDLYFSLTDWGMQGESCGVLTALCFLQLLTECYFHETAVITGGITFRGKITNVDGADIIYNGVRQWCGRYVYPVDNQAEMDPILAEIGAGTKTEQIFHPVSTMGDVVEAMVTDAGLNKKECVAFSTDVAATYLACHVEVNGRLELVQIEACVVPGSGQLRFTGDVPGIVHDEAWTALHWVVRNAEDIMTVVKHKAPHAEVLIDWGCMRYTRRHPYADEMQEDGENDFVSRASICASTYVSRLDICLMLSTRPRWCC